MRCLNGFSRQSTPPSRSSVMPPLKNFRSARCFGSRPANPGTERVGCQFAWRAGRKWRRGGAGILLHPEKYGALLSDTISALQPAADNGNQEAVEALTSVAKNQNDQPLWMLTANSLAKAAAAGNPVAIDALISMSSTTNRNTPKCHRSSLERSSGKSEREGCGSIRSMGIQ